MNFMIWFIFALPVGFIIGAIGMALWLMLKPLAVIFFRAVWSWVKASVVV